MGASYSAKVTLHSGIECLVRRGDVLIIAEDCYDISDKVLLSSRIKYLKKGDMVVVQDIYITSDATFRAVRAIYNTKLYYLSAASLTTIKLA